MSRGAHAGPRKPSPRPGARTRIVLSVLGVLVGLATCAAIGWVLVAIAIRVGVLVAAGALAVLVLVVVLSWLTISRRRTRAATAGRG